MGGSLPALVSLEQSLPILKQWQQQANDALALPAAARPPFTLQARGNGTQIILSWEVVQGADGYELQTSSNGDFSTVTNILSLKGANTTGFTDASLVPGATRCSRSRSPAGADNNPQVVKGQWSAPVQTSSTVTTPVYDQVTHLPTWTRPKR